MSPDDYEALTMERIHAVRRILDTLPPGSCSEEVLRQTPRRVARMYQEMTSGYSLKPEDVLKTFPSDCDELVVVRGIPFASLCAHHLLPFVGVAHVGYLPNGSVFGLSKLPRVVDVFAKRLQLQETMTGQIADAIYLWHSLPGDKGHVAPKGVGVVVEASHGCVSCRGVAKAGVTMVTSALRGNFKQSEIRAEFLKLVKG